MRSKAQIKFVNKSKTDFFETLKKRVDEYFVTNNLSKHYNLSMVIKSIILLSAYLLPFVYMLVFQPSFGVCLVLWSIMGFAMAGVGMSVMHDSNHGAYSESKTVNDWIGYSLNLLGGSITNWKMQHNVLHHTYTNIIDVDDDIDDKLIMRFSPHTKVKWYHKIQHFYSFFFYGILTVYWVALKDYVQFFKYAKTGVNTTSKNEKRMALLKITILKIIYFFIVLVMPVVYFNMNFGEILAGFLLFHFIGGFVLTTVFQLAHTVEGTSHPLPLENGTIENNWAIHQLNTTVNFARSSKLISWYVGGLNFQVEHHLFPRICHVHYPEIAPIVKQTCEEYGVPYLENQTLMEALRSHVITLKRFGMPDLDEAIG